MAEFRARKKPNPIKIEKFLGINEAVGDTEVNPGEWIRGFNARVTKDYKIQKRSGHHKFINFGSGDVQGLWIGSIAGKDIMLSCWNGSVYEYDTSVTTSTVDIADLITEGTVTIIGGITDVKTSITWFDGKILFLNGTDFKEYDGTTYQDVQPYIPTVALEAPPAGGGTLFEEINLLTGLKKQTFVGDGSTVLYQLAEDNIDATTVLITVDGVPKTEGVDFSVNRPLGQVTFNVAPANLSVVEIQWDKVVSGNADLVKNHKYMLVYGYINDTNLFIYGNDNEKNVFRFSGVGKYNYFPVNSFVSVASNQYAITSLTPQYQSLLVFKEDSTHVVNPTVNPNFATNTGLNPYDYGYEGFNDSIGNKAPGMVQLVKDSPVSLDGSSFRYWVSRYGVRNEVEPGIVSDRLKLSLQEVDFSQAVTCDYEYQKELWVNVGNVVYIWNYGNDTMYKYDNISATCFAVEDQDIYFGSDGAVNLYKTDFLADSEDLGDNITMKLYGGFLDFDTLQYRKMMRDEWLAIKPDSRTSVKIKFVTDRTNEEVAKWYDVDYKLLDFNNIDFDDWTFLTSRSAQVNRIKGKVKKFVYIQWIMENDTNNETLTVLKLLMQCQTQGYSR